MRRINLTTKGKLIFAALISGAFLVGLKGSSNHDSTQITISIIFLLVTIYYLMLVIRKPIGWFRLTQKG